MACGYRELSFAIRSGAGRDAGSGAGGLAGGLSVGVAYLAALPGRCLGYASARCSALLAAVRPRLAWLRLGLRAGRLPRALRCVCRGRSCFRRRARGGVCGTARRCQAVLPVSLRDGETAFSRGISFPSLWFFLRFLAGLPLASGLRLEVLSRRESCPWRRAG